MINTREIAEEYRLSHWAQIMHERMESGMSIKAYCRQLGISTNTYFYRQKKLRESACAHLAAQDHESLKASAPPRLGASYAGRAVPSKGEPDD